MEKELVSLGVSTKAVNGIIEVLSLKSFSKLEATGHALHIAYKFLNRNFSLPEFTGESALAAASDKYRYIEKSHTTRRIGRRISMERENTTGMGSRRCWRSTRCCSAGSVLENKAFLTFVIPRDKEPFLTSFFAELQNRESEFGISDIQLGLTTLEEVFLNIAKQAELESSAAEGNLVTLNLTSGTSIQVPKGVRFVGIPGMKSEEHLRGMMVQVFWDIDEAGTLCISGHSPETPIPANVELNRTPSLSWRASLPHGMSIGFVIEPSQILNQS
ncbi:hypothetical protein FCM35_KLT14780 [Carex littledalei]|uniref:ABC transporter A family member 2/9/11 C-terminal domain-containing protein n=1 Tax=Carex littledalei TaxID=544730 RepID=A0A833QI58_9POAL|nr:hypothetical protein FCM35_KLT14780 [Carex littledalei]